MFHNVVRLRLYRNGSVTVVAAELFKNARNCFENSFVFKLYSLSHPQIIFQLLFQKHVRFRSNFNCVSWGKNKIVLSNSFIKIINILKIEQQKKTTLNGNLFD